MKSPLLPLLLPAVFVLGSTPAFAQADSVDAFVRRAMITYHIPGLSLAIARKGNPTALRAYGSANLEVAAPVTPASVFKIGSVTKQFTAAAILMLVDDGTVALENDAATYLPDIAEMPKGISVRQLLSHTSGIVDYTDIPNSVAQARNDRRPREVVKPALLAPLQFSPGSRYTYSNTNYVLLAMIVERASGNRNYGVILRERIFGPLGMSATRPDDRGAVITQRASGYNWVSGTQLNGEFMSPTNNFGSGNLLSTAEDLVKWTDALHAGRVLKPGTLAQMLAPANLASGQSVRYGLGVELGTHAGHRVAGHGGETVGFNATVVRYLDDGLTIAVLTNQGEAPTDDIARGIAGILLGLPAEPTIAASIPDREPGVTAKLRQVVTDAALGTPDSAAFTPDAQRDLVPMIRRGGREFLGNKGTMTAFALVERRDENGMRVYVYQQTFSEGPPTFWTFQLTSGGLIAAMEPRAKP